MMDLIRKRHEGDGWIVCEELGDKPGMYANRRADAVALGVWNSTKYELHGYECKQSREDVKNDLRDPTKSQAVGAYCHHWWLVISDPKIIEGLVVPAAWGILTPKTRGGSRVLAVVRKAPRLKPKVFDVMFAVSMIRNIHKLWVSPAKHAAVVAELDALKHGPPLSDEEVKKGVLVHNLERQLKDLQARIDRFEGASGVSISDDYNGKRIGAAVRYVIDHPRTDVDQIRQGAKTLSEAAETFETRARELAQAAVAMRALAPELPHAKFCQSKNLNYPGLCSCGVTPSSDAERALLAQAARDAPLDRESSDVALDPVDHSVA